MVKTSIFWSVDWLTNGISVMLTENQWLELISFGPLTG
jgi:hypothetical protein